MHLLLWVLQCLGALVYGASGTMKVFMFDEIRGVPSFGALPEPVWMALGVLELCCSIALVVPGALGWRPTLTSLAAAALALESLIFIGVDVSYGETGSIVMGAVLGLVMGFVAYGRRSFGPAGSTLT